MKEKKETKDNIKMKGEKMKKIGLIDDFFDRPK